jgi:hypothetical protein
VFELVWSIIAILAAFAICGGVVYFLVTGHEDRDREEEARAYFDEHGHWPDEAPADPVAPADYHPPRAPMV